VQSNKVLLIPGILAAMAILISGETAFAQSDSINDLVSLMPCQASCEWVYNDQSGRLCEREAEFSCANVGEDRPCEPGEYGSYSLDCN
jgi:hypothetical protein